jgi:putative thioredoxin
MTSHTIEVNNDNFIPTVIEGSKKAPVVVDFWAPWCAPCRALGPVLEKLAAEYGGRFTLAKINSDEQPQLAMEYGVRGIPNVKAFVDGRIADEFSGALPESAVRAFIDRIVPSAAERMRAQAMALYRDDGDAAKALAALEQAAAADPGNEPVKIDAAEILIALDRLDEARDLLQDLSPLAQMDERVAALRAQIDFAATAEKAPDTRALEQRIAHKPDDLDARLQFAKLQVAAQHHRQALDQLLEIVRRDRSFGDDIGRKTILQVFSVLGNDSDLVSEYRKRLASALN